MAILHKNITASADIHNPKWFTDANNGDYAFKNEKGELESIDELLLPAALNFVDGSVAPPTTSTGDIYILSSGGSVNAGWGSVALQDWVRYDGTAWNSITPQKSSLCYDKTADSLMSFNGTAWASIGGGGGTDVNAVHVNVASEISAITAKATPTTSDFILIEDAADSNNKKKITIGDLPSSTSSGIVGIANSSGVYTYYATYTLAMAAASAGDTVEQFGNITETGNVTITIPNEVNVNLNGYTYTLDGSDNTLFSKGGSGTKTKFINGTIIKKNSPTPNGGGGGLSVTQTAELDCTGLTVISDGATVLNFNTSGSGQGLITKGNFIYDGTNTGFISFIEGRLDNAFINTGTGIIRVTGDGLYNSTIFGAIATTGAAVLKNCIINNTLTSIALTLSSARAYNCTIYSQSSTAVFLNNASSEIHNSTAKSASGVGISVDYGKVYNCTGVSTSTIGLYINQVTAEAYNSIGESNASGGIELRKGRLVNCVGKSTYNNAAGHGIRLGNSTGMIIGCTGIVVNSSAFAVQGISATRSVDIVGLKGYGMTTLIGGSVSNTQTNTPDSFNNTLMG